MINQNHQVKIHQINNNNTKNQKNFKIVFVKNSFQLFLERIISKISIKTNENIKPEKGVVINNIRTHQSFEKSLLNRIILFTIFKINNIIQYKDVSKKVFHKLLKFIFIPLIIKNIKNIIKGNNQHKDKNNKYLKS